MKAAVIRFLVEMHSDQLPRWITLVGPSGIGKTSLAKWIMKEWEPMRKYFTHPKLGIAQMRVSRYWDWRKKADQFRDFDMTGFESAEECDLLVIDDVGSEHDPSGFVLSKLDRILNSRLGKWTVLTSNLSLRDIAGKLDARIASRIMRGASIVVEAAQNTPDFAI